MYAYSYVHAPEAVISVACELALIFAASHGLINRLGIDKTVQADNSN